MMRNEPVTEMEFEESEEYDPVFVAMEGATLPAEVKDEIMEKGFSGSQSGVLSRFSFMCALTSVDRL